MPPDMPRAPAAGLLLDFGSVISYSIFEIMGEVEEGLGLQPGTLGWRGPLDPEADNLWRKMQRDEITERDYWAQRAEEAGARAGKPLSVLDFMVGAYNLPQEKIVRPEMAEAVTVARRAGKRVGVLTNELELFHGKPWMDSLSILRAMDCMVDATHTHILKPDPRAYLLAIEAMGVPAGQIVFLDDQMRNVEGARRAGLIGIHFDVRTPDTSLGQAMDLLGLR